MASLPFFPFWYQDYLEKTMPVLDPHLHLTNEEHGAYLLLILKYWMKGEALTLEEVLRVSKCERNANALRCLERFFIIQKNETGIEIWIHKRVEEELAKARENSQNSREKSEKATESANARWKEEKKRRIADANAMRSQSDGNANYTYNQNHTQNQSYNNTESNDTLLGSLDKNYNSTSERKEIDAMIHKQISDVFSHWVEIHAGNDPGGTAVLDETRNASIQKMLNLGYSVEDLKLAIEGCALSPFHSGKNKKGEVHNRISQIFRDADQVEKFIDIAKERSGKKDRVEEFLETHKDDRSVAFLNIMKTMESQCEHELTLEQLNLYHKSLKRFDLAAIEGGIFDFHQKAEAKDGKYPKVKLLIDLVALRQRDIDSEKQRASDQWDKVIELTVYDLDGMNNMVSKTISGKVYQRTGSILRTAEYRSQLPEKFEDFMGNQKAKEKFIELFLKIEEEK